jgi:hypothetical protein
MIPTSQFMIPGENPAVFDELLAALTEEYQPQNTGENILVRNLAQAWWLRQRAIRLQGESLHDPKRLNLFICYQAAMERSLHCAFNHLVKLKKGRKIRLCGFESQKDERTFQRIRARYGDEDILALIMHDRIEADLARIEKISYIDEKGSGPKRAS